VMLTTHLLLAPRSWAELRVYTYLYPPCGPVQDSSGTALLFLLIIQAQGGASPENDRLHSNKVHRQR
jgi:hypothetical protein